MGASKQRVLLALLLVRAGRPVSAERLMDELWPDARPATARNTLHSLVLRLRHALAELAAGEPGSGHFLVRRGDGYTLDVEVADIDARLFEELAARGRRKLADRDAHGASTCLREALALWRGPALVDVADAPLLRLEAGRLDELRLAVAEACVEAELQLGRHAEVVGEVKALLAEHPLRERAWGQLMVALYRSGRQPEALAAFRQVYRLLREDQGVDPSVELRELHRRILHDDQELRHPRPRIMADHVAMPRELPAAARPFVGRVRDLRTLDALLSGTSPAASSPLCVICGSAGIGKTALAVRWAHQVADRFPDGQIYLDLRGYSATAAVSPSQALAHLLRSLGVDAEKIPVDVDLAAGMYRTLVSGNRILVVLDNAATVGQVRPLLPGTPQCAVLVTSRDRLDGLVVRDGAARVTLDVLSTDEAVALVAQAVGTDRARGEPGQVARLAELCGGVPLALRIAAARLGDQPDRGIADYVAALAQNRWTALEIVGDQESTVRTSFDLSYLLLGTAERKMFQLMGLAPGMDLSAEAAAALADTTVEQAARTLRLLTSMSLADEHAPDRYALHDLIKAYADDLAEADLTDEDRCTALRRLLGWYLDGACSAAAVRYPRRFLLGAGAADSGRFEPGAASAWLAAERVNLIAATHEAANGGLDEVAVRLTGALDHYLWSDGHFADCLALADAGLRAARNLGDLRAQAVMRGSLGRACWTVGDYRTAVGHYWDALGLFRQVGARADEARMLINLGLVHWELGQLDEAADCTSAALVIQQDDGDLDGQAYALDLLACVDADRGRIAAATAHDAQALAIARRLGSKSNVVSILGNLACWRHQLGHPRDALGLLGEAMIRQREIGTVLNDASLLDTYAVIHRDAARYEQALGYAQRCLARAREHRLRRAETEALNTLASIHLARGAFDAALSLYAEALHLSHETGYRSGEAAALTGLAAALQDSRHLDEAADRAETALAVARRSGYRVHEARALTVLAEIQLERGGARESVDTGLEALAIHRESGYRLGEARTLSVLGRAMQSRHDPVQGERHLRDAEAIYARIGAESTRGAHPDALARRS